MIVETGIQPISTRIEPPGSQEFGNHRGPVTCVAGIPGRNAAVSSGYDAALGLVDFEQGTIQLLGYHRHLVNRVVVNPSGTLAASCSSDYTACLWDLQSLSPRRVLQGHWDDVEDFAFVDDTTGISVSRDRRIFIWNLDTGAITRVLEGHERDVLSVQYSRGKIYTSGDDRTLRQWDLQNGAMLNTWGPFEVETDTCAIDPLLNRVVLGSDDGCIRIFDCDTGADIGMIEAHASGIKKVAVSPVNGDILSAAYDQRILVWDAQDLELKQELDRHIGTWERSLNWTPNGARVLAGTFDGTVVRWDADSGKLRVELTGNGAQPGNACFNDVSCLPSGLTASVSDDGQVRLAKLAKQESEWLDQAIPASGRVLMNAVYLTAAPSDEAAENLVWTGAHDQKLHVFDVGAGQISQHRELNLRCGPINCIRVHKPGVECLEAFVATYSGTVVRVLREAGGDLSITSKLGIHDGAVKSVRIHPQEPIGASGAADGSLCTWGFDGTILHQFAGHTAIVDDVDFDPSGRWLASVSRDFTVNVFEVSSGRLLHSILLGRQSPKCVLFWDEDTVLVGNYWGAVWRVDLTRGEVIPFGIAGNGISSLARCGAGMMAAASYDGSIYLLETDGMTVCDRIQSMSQKLPGFEFRASFDP